MVGETLRGQSDQKKRVCNRLALSSVGSMSINDKGESCGNLSSHSCDNVGMPWSKGLRNTYGDVCYMYVPVRNFSGGRYSPPRERFWAEVNSPR